MRRPEAVHGRSDEEPGDRVGCRSACGGKGLRGPGRGRGLRRGVGHGGVLVGGAQQLLCRGGSFLRFRWSSSITFSVAYMGVLHRLESVSEGAEQLSLSLYGGFQRVEAGRHALDRNEEVVVVGRHVDGVFLNTTVVKRGGGAPLPVSPRFPPPARR